MCNRLEEIMDMRVVAAAALVFLTAMPAAASQANCMREMNAAIDAAATLAESDFQRETVGAEEQYVEDIETADAIYKRALDLTETNHEEAYVRLMSKMHEITKAEAADLTFNALLDRALARNAAHRDMQRRAHLSAIRWSKAVTDAEMKRAMRLGSKVVEIHQQYEGCGDPTAPTPPAPVQVPIR